MQQANVVNNGNVVAKRLAVKLATKRSGKLQGTGTKGIVAQAFVQGGASGNTKSYTYQQLASLAGTTWQKVRTSCNNLANTATSGGVVLALTKRGKGALTVVTYQGHQIKPFSFTGKATKALVKG